MRPTDYAKIAYDAYCEDAEGKSLVTGDDLPEWKDLTVAVKGAWVSAAMAVKYAHKDNILRAICREGGV